MLFLDNTSGNADSTNWANNAAEVAAYTFRTHKTWTACVMIEYDRLMPTIVARHLASAATDTLFLVELRINNGVAVKTVGILELGQMLANQLLQF